MKFKSGFTVFKKSYFPTSFGSVCSYPIKINYSNNNKKLRIPDRQSLYGFKTISRTCSHRRYKSLESQYQLHYC